MPVKMGKKHYGQRLIACVERGKCVQGVDLPVLNPGAHVTEGRISVRRKPHKTRSKKGREEKVKVTDERIMQLFENELKERRISREESVIKDSSIDTALDMLRKKENLRKMNKMGAELVDIKDRMASVVDYYEGLADPISYSVPLEDDVLPLIDTANLMLWRNDVTSLLLGYEDKCRQRLEVLTNLVESLPKDSTERVNNITASICEEKIKEAANVILEIIENLENWQTIGRKLHFLHYSIVNIAVSAANERARRQSDIPRKMRDNSRDKIEEMKYEADAWKHAANEIVDLLKSARKEGINKMGGLESNLQALLTSFESQSEHMMELQEELKNLQEKIAQIEMEKRRILDDNFLLQDQVHRAYRENKMMQKASQHLENKLKAYLEKVCEEELHLKAEADDHEAKEILYIKRIQRLKSQLEKRKEESSSVGVQTNQVASEKRHSAAKRKRPTLEVQKDHGNSADDQDKPGEEQDSAVNEHGNGCSEYECQECHCLAANLQRILKELEEERNAKMYLEALLAESQLQMDKASHVELMEMKNRNKKQFEGPLSVTSKDLPSIKHQPLHSQKPGQASYLPTKISTEHVRSSDESGYTSHGQASYLPTKISTEHVRSSDESGYTSHGQASHLPSKISIEHVRSSDESGYTSHEVTADESSHQIGKVAPRRTFSTTPGEKIALAQGSINGDSKILPRVATEAKYTQTDEKALRITQSMYLTQDQMVHDTETLINLANQIQSEQLEDQLGNVCADISKIIRYAKTVRPNRSDPPRILSETSSEAGSLKSETTSSHQATQMIDVHTQDSTVSIGNSVRYLDGGSFLTNKQDTTDKRIPSGAQSSSLRKPSENFNLLETPSITVNGQMSQEFERQNDSPGTNASVRKDASGNVDWRSNATHSPAKELDISESYGPFDDTMLFPPKVESSSQYLLSDGTLLPERPSSLCDDRVSQGDETSKESNGSTKTSDGHAMEGSNLTQNRRMGQDASDRTSNSLQNINLSLPEALDPMPSVVLTGRVNQEAGPSKYGYIDTISSVPQNTTSKQEAENRTGDVEQNKTFASTEARDSSQDKAAQDAQLHVGDARLHDEDVRLHDGDARLHVGDARSYVLGAQLHDGDAQVHDGDARLHDGDARLHVGDARFYDGDARLHDGDARLHAGEARLQDEDPRIKTASLEQDMALSSPEVQGLFQHRGTQYIQSKERPIINHRLETLMDTNASLKSPHEFQGATKHIPKKLKTNTKAGDAQYGNTLHNQESLSFTRHSTSEFQLLGKSSKIFGNQASSGRDTMKVINEEKGDGSAKVRGNNLSVKDANFITGDGNGKVRGNNLSVKDANSIKQLKVHFKASLSDHSKLKKSQFKVAFKELQLQIDSIVGGKLKAYSANLNRSGKADGRLNRLIGRKRHSIDVIKVLREFLTKSWKLLEQNTMYNIENPQIGSKDVASSYAKSLAEHAEIIMQALGVSIMELFPNEDENSTSNDGALIIENKKEKISIISGPGVAQMQVPCNQLAKLNSSSVTPQAAGKNQPRAEDRKTTIGLRFVDREDARDQDKINEDVAVDKSAKSKRLEDNGFQLTSKGFQLPKLESSPKTVSTAKELPQLMHGTNAHPGPRKHHFQANEPAPDLHGLLTCGNSYNQTSSDSQKLPQIGTDGKHTAKQIITRQAATNQFRKKEKQIHFSGNQTVPPSTKENSTTFTSQESQPGGPKAYPRTEDRRGSLVKPSSHLRDSKALQRKYTAMKYGLNHTRQYQDSGVNMQYFCYGKKRR